MSTLWEIPLSDYDNVHVRGMRRRSNTHHTQCSYVVQCLFLHVYQCPDSSQNVQIKLMFLIVLLHVPVHVNTPQYYTFSHLSTLCLQRVDCVCTTIVITLYYYVYKTIHSAVLVHYLLLFILVVAYLEYCIPFVLGVIVPKVLYSQ